MIAGFVLVAAVAALATHPVAPSISGSGADVAIIPSDKPLDFEVASGAAQIGGPSDKLCSGQNLRTGNPGQTSQIRLAHPLLAPGYKISSISLHFRYVAGYTPGANKTAIAPTVSVLLTDATGKMLANVSTSSPLGNYSFDHFQGYSPPVHASNSQPLAVANDELVLIVLSVSNHQRNLQIPIVRHGRALEHMCSDHSSYASPFLGALYSLRLN